MKKITAIILAEVIVMAFTLSGCDSSDYKKAMELYNEGNYTEAAAMFEKLGDYEDSAKMLDICTNEAKLIEADELLKAGDTEAVKAILDEVGGYEGATDMITAYKFVTLDHFIRETPFDLYGIREFYRALPEDYEYNGVTVAEQKQMLEKYKEFVDICGGWTCSQDSPVRLDTSYYSWTSEVLKEYPKMTIFAKINEDGTVSLLGEAEFIILTSGSGQYQELTLPFKYTGATMPSNIPIDNYSTDALTVSCSLDYTGSAFIFKPTVSMGSIKSTGTFKYDTHSSYASIDPTEWDADNSDSAAAEASNDFGDTAQSTTSAQTGGESLSLQKADGMAEINYVGWEHPPKGFFSDNSIDVSKVICLLFDYTNNSEDPNYVGNDFSMSAYQNGVQLDGAVELGSVHSGVYEPAENLGKQTIMGGTITIGNYFLLEDDSPVTVIVKDRWSDNKQTMTINIK